MNEADDPAKTMNEAAPAKINLYLHVLGRRADGYHRLDSLVMFADVADTVTVAPGGSLRFSVDGPFAAPLAAEPADANLVVRAAKALAEAVGRPADVDLTLTKRLPVASGIGGGSADAAACLRALARLWEVAPDDARLLAVAARLGADVPVCLKGQAAFFGGIGDVLDPAPALPDCPAVLVNPGVPLSTPAVFRARQGGVFSAPGRFTGAPADPAALAALLGERRNDLTEAAISLAPVVADALAALAGTAGCRLARLSGSGATCFGLFATADDAARAARALADGHADWWVRACRLRSA